MKTTKEAKREAKQLYRLCFVNGKLDQARVRQVVGGMIHSRHRGYLTVLRYFQQLVKLECARHTATIDSAVMLPTGLQNRVLAGLERAYGPGIAAIFGRNPALIGGIRIQVGSDVFDGSVRSELIALEKRFGIVSANGRNASRPGR
jgi:F-type H+-transporting ATPase subunit delta